MLLNLAKRVKQGNDALAAWTFLPAPAASSSAWRHG